MMSVRLVTCTPEDSVGEASRRMVAANVGAVLVCTDDGLVGILTERDVLHLAAAARDMEHEYVRDHLHADLIVVEPDAPVLDVAELMNEHRIRHLPVVEGRVPVGIVSLRDFFVLSGAVLRARGADAAGELLHAATGPGGAA
jgi:CBS domain-containing protein